MTPSDDLFDRALSLSVSERAALAKRLLESLDSQEPPGSTDVEAAWAGEIERRAEEVLNGTARLVPAEEVFARIRALTKR